jgi:hypothetical protein
MAGIPSAVASNRRWSATQGKTTFSLSGTQMIGGGFKAATESVGKTNWPVSDLMPHFPSFAPHDWEKPDDSDAHLARHPYASAGIEQGSLSVNEKVDKDTPVDLSTFVSYVPRPRPSPSFTAKVLSTDNMLPFSSLTLQLRLPTHARARGWEQVRHAAQVRLAQAEQARRTDRGHRDEGERVIHDRRRLSSACGPSRHRAARARGLP